MRRTPWAEWFAFGVGVLGLSSRAFWRLSLWEWLALIGAQSAPPPTRSELDALLKKEANSE